MWYDTFWVIPLIPDAREWLDQAEYDFSTAEAMFQAGRYLYVIYMCQLAVEKALKAIVTHKTRKAPPRTHKLVYLTELADIDLPESYLEFLGTLDAVGAGARYPKDLAATLKAYSRDIAKRYLEKTEEFLEWLRQEFMLQL